MSSSNRALRGAAILAVAVVVVGAFVAFDAPPPAAAAASDALGADRYLVSRTNAGTSDQSVLSTDGQHVVFRSTEALVPEDLNGVADVYLATAKQGSTDPFSGTPVLVSRASTGGIANGPSSEPALSADGRYVVFTSTATNLVAGGSAGGRRELYIRDTVLNTTVRVQAGAEPDDDTWDADISADGSHLVFLSEAANLPGADTDHVADVFVADREDSTGGISPTTFTIRGATGGTSDSGAFNGPVISGNGAYIVYGIAGKMASGAAADELYRTAFDTLQTEWTGNSFGQLALRTAAVDSTGALIAAVAIRACDEAPIVVAINWVIGGVASAAAVGSGPNPLIYRGAGDISEVAMSEDGSRVTWASTQPVSPTGTEAPALAQPEIRSAAPNWSETYSGFTCSPQFSPTVLQLGTGTSPSMSASGRSIAFSGPTAAAPGAAASVIDVDTRDNSSGLSVTSIAPDVPAPSFLTSISTDSISAAAIHDYGSAFASAPIYHLPIYHLPIYHLPIYHLPIYHLPIYHLPIYHLPIYHLDLPGGWTDVLAGTEFAGRSELDVTLAEVLSWADEHRNSPSATPAQIAAIARIDSLTLNSVEVDGTGIGALSLGALMLGGTPLAQVVLPGQTAGTAAWQALVDAQGLDITVGADTLLADLDFGGFDVGASGVDDVPLRSLPIATTLFGDIPADELELSGTSLGAVTVAELTDASALLPAGATGTLADNRAAFRPGTTAATIASIVPASITFGDLLASFLDRGSYPWEQIKPSALNPSDALDVSTSSCGLDGGCQPYAPFTFSFDPGPGQPVDFPQAIADVFVPTGAIASGVSRTAAGVVWSSPEENLAPGSYQVDRERARIPLGDMRAGNIVSFRVLYLITSDPNDGSTRGVLTVGSATASTSTSYHRRPQDYDDAAHNLVDGQWQSPTGGQPLEENVIYYGWISPRDWQTDDDGRSVTGPAGDEDYYVIRAPQAGQRVVVSSNATDGQVSLALYRPESDSTALGVADLGPAPGVGATEQASGTNGDPSTIGSDAAAPLAGNVLVDQAVVAGDGAAQVDTAGGGADMLLRVTSGNGLSSSSLYSLRVQYIDEPKGPSCTPWSAPAGDTATVGLSGDAHVLDEETNTLYLLDAGRFDDTWGAGSAQAVADRLYALDTAASAAPVHGLVLTVDTDLAVQTARTQLDADPCDMAARAALVKAVNGVVTQTLGARRAQITSVVIVGGDDILPLAPVAQNTGQFNEQSHAGDLRRSAQLDGTACPSSIPPGADDPCATPLSAAAATNHILTDDPYALASAYATVGGTLYVPSVAIGRLVETPADITATVQRFLDQAGTLAADSALTGGYGSWAKLPDQITSDLDWRVPVGASTKLTEPWNAGALTAALFPAGDSPAVVSINAHFDETAMLPGVTNAAGGVSDPHDLYTTADVTAAQQAKLAGSLLFTIGCHAGDNLPSSYYPNVRDWVDVFGGAAGFVGNTGYGLANDTATALSARLLDLYAQWIGVSTGGAPVSAGGALVQAKHAYLAGLGLYSGYDEKAVMEAVYYGLPMYTFGMPVKDAPLPKIPDSLGDPITKGSLTTASLTLSPDFRTRTSGDDTYVVVDGEDPAVVPGEPVLPKTTMQLDPAPLGKAARGVLITSLTSELSDTVSPLISSGTAGGTDPAAATRSDMVFPSAFAHLTTQQTPDRLVDLLVVTPGRVQARADGQGVIETFTDMGLQVVYGDSASTDAVAPEFTSVEVFGGTHPGLSAAVDPTSVGDSPSTVVAVFALVQAEGSHEWTKVDLVHSASDPALWSVDLPAGSGPQRWMLQAVDSAGNTSLASNRGLVGITGASAPALGDAGSAATVAVGEHLTRSIVVTDATADDRLTATYSLDQADTSEPSRTMTGAAPVALGADGVTRVDVDAIMTTPGSYTAHVRVCRVDQCTTTSFPVTVPEPNRPPTASVDLTPAARTALPTATLTAHASAEDPDGDDVTLAYRWLRNAGQEIGAAPTLPLTGLVQPGDTVTVEVTASDGSVTGGAARSTIVVAEGALAPPTITATAATSAGPYTEGAWSSRPVKVTFECAAAGGVKSCTRQKTVSVNTTEDGVWVVGTVVDKTGLTATTSVLVRIDRTKPTLAPVITPNPVIKGRAATATPNARDALSGVSTQSCDPPSTARVGVAKVTCRATDAAGNTASAIALYRVLPVTSPTCQGLPDRTALAPLNADGSSVFSRFSGVPLLFRACDASGKPIGTKGFVASVALVSVAPLPSAARVNELPYLVPTVKPVYSSQTKLWAGAIGAGALTSGKLYTYRVNLADGTSVTVTFGVR